MCNPAAAAYEAYREHMNMERQEGSYLLPWHLLSPIEHRAWWLALGAVAKAEKTGPELGDSRCTGV